MDSNRTEFSDSELKRRFAALTETARILSSASDLRSAVREILDAVRRSLSADRIVALVRADGRAALVPFDETALEAFDDGHGLELSGSDEPISVFTEGGGRIVRGLGSRGASGSSRWYAENAEQALIAALRIAREPLGVVIAFRNNGAATFGEEDLSLAEILTPQLSSSLAQLVLQREKQSLARNLDSAANAREEFFAALSHELRAPLTPILTWTQILGRQAKLERRWQRAVDVIQRNARHEARLIDDLLDVLLIRHGELKLNRRRLDLKSHLRLAAETVNQHPEFANVAVAVEVPAEPLEVEADPARLQQIFVALLDGAFRDIVGGGSIEIGARRLSNAVKIQIRASAGGFDPEQAERFFEMLGDAAPETGMRRLGVGLTLAKHLAEQHGGSIIALSSGRGTGATYEVTLPAAPVAAARAARPLARPLEGVEVLIVEDHDDTREALAALLESQQVHVRTAANGAAGIAAALSHKPDVVLCDLAMPGVDGYEVARRLRQEPGWSAVPIFALSGYGMPLDRERTLAAGFSAHLVKPVDAAELMSLIDDAREHVAAE